jgi:hypothetical protein
VRQNIGAQRDTTRAKKGRGLLLALVSRKQQVRYLKPKSKLIYVPSFREIWKKYVLPAL